MSKLKTLSFLTALCAISTSALASLQPLTIYTEEFFGADWGPGNEVKALFEKANPQCTVIYKVFDNRNTMFNRVRLEGKKIPADIVIGLDNFQKESAAKTGLFAKTAVDLSALSLPFDWQDQTFIPYEFGQFAFIYDKTKLTNPPQTLKELVERQDLRVIYQDPRTSSMGRGFLVWLNQVYSQDQVEQAWKTLAKHTVTVGKGWTETYGAFLKGESDVVFSHSTSPIYHQLHDKTDQYAATEFSDGAVYQVDTISKIAKEQVNQCADHFIQFMISPEAQKVLIPKNVMLSVSSAEIEPHFDELKAHQFEVKAINTDKVSEQDIKAWTEKWQAVLSQ
ncbi:thiamine ABC transporter substrate binding subunit [Lonepinella koalarum]|uniref:Thiamine-binding periplasmic protein n=1 Tax=Lonepinella koalarum TaxID=53417 RepID=A0A4R1L083_9PAST|nr:thiamine ABC transporter substrate binding subunit [Lonepinella koalarum]MDH2926967.1 thiamine ABC transporter substrate-binding protein [Lonepinella koalarum]TCK70377.1 thiamine transport system substrate-binding protein [Lonepinella koalarum]TFJ89240.1 thiamine ABC transporter substrate binding subunit [Lonepinella koalarum]